MADLEAILKDYLGKMEALKLENTMLQEHVVAQAETIDNLKTENDQLKKQQEASQD